MARRTASPRPPRLRGKALIVVVLVLAFGWAAIEAHEAGWIDLGGLYEVLTGEAPPPRPRDDPPAASSDGGEALRLVTWNVANFGRSKDDAEMAVIADLLAPAADVVAIQEVSTTSPGTDAVVRLSDALNARQGAWDWTVSNPTTGEGGSERYAFLWRTDRVRVEGACALVRALEDALDREPFVCGFVRLGAERTEPVRVASFHAVPSSKDPARENALLHRLHDLDPEADLVVVGDFNLPADRPAFDGLRERGFREALVDQKTTLKTVRTPAGEHLANAYDNVFYEPAELTALRAEVLDFSDRFSSLREARAISDHLPVRVTFAWP